MKLNNKVKIELDKAKIDSNEGALYLLAIYFHLDVSCISEIIQKKVNLTKIVERDFAEDTHTIKWNIPLFDGEKPTESHWEWVNEWRNLFKKVNPERNGVLQSCIGRMKIFFSRYPNYRQNEVMLATKAYLSSVSEPQYCKKAHKFISEGAGVNEYSLLLEWCERMKDTTQRVSFKKMGD